jgi:hypothetical protein
MSDEELASYIDQDELGMLAEIIGEDGQLCIDRKAVYGDEEKEKI